MEGIQIGEEQVFLRNDMNNVKYLLSQLFNNMMVSANFNLKKNTDRV